MTALGSSVVGLLAGMLIVRGASWWRWRAVDRAVRRSGLPYINPAATYRPPTDLDVAVAEEFAEAWARSGAPPGSLPLLPPDKTTTCTEDRP